MIRSNRRILSAFLALALVLCLTSCASQSASKNTSTDAARMTLPLKEQNAPQAPYGDARDSEVYRASIYYASGDGSVSVPSTRVLWLNSQSTIEYRLAEELMKVPGGDAYSVVSKGSRIASAESSGGIVTVNVLPASSMTAPEIRTLAEAMVRTLTELDGVSSVNLLLHGRAASVYCLPLGLIHKTADISALFDESLHFNKAEDTPLVRRAIGYFPSKDETCVLPMEITVHYNPADPAEAVLRALQTTPASGEAVSGVPACETMFERKSHYEILPGGDRILYVHLTNDALLALNQSGHNRHMYLASIVLSLTTFLPETDGVVITIGGKTITEVPLSNGTTRTFSSGIMKREHFAPYIGKNITLYFANENNMLVPETRALPLSEADSARARICELIEGPSDPSLLPVFPNGMKSSDILGVQISGSVASVNLSANVYSLAQSFTRSEEELFVYSLVNTLSELRGVSGVRLYFNGLTGSVLTHNVYLEGVLLKNPGRIQASDNSASN